MQERPASERPRSIIAPGEAVKAIFEKTFVSDAQAARRLGLSPGDLALFYSGELPLTRDLAFRLREPTGLTASHWLGFERQYRRRLRRWREETGGAAPEKGESPEN